MTKAELKQHITKAAEELIKAGIPGVFVVGAIIDGKTDEEKRVLSHHCVGGDEEEITPIEMVDVVTRSLGDCVSAIGKDKVTFFHTE